MRRCVALALVLLVACRQEPTFDERYDAAEKELQDRATEIDAELATQSVPEVESPSRER
jgi:hypothetical protein